MKNTYTPDNKPLYTKYRVFRAGEKGEILDEVEGFTFTLRLPDPHARKALLRYAKSVRAENPLLAAELVSLLIQFESASAGVFANLDESDLTDIYEPDIYSLIAECDKLREQLHDLKNGIDELDGEVCE
jgi:hypothetical protein